MPAIASRLAIKQQMSLRIMEHLWSCGGHFGASGEEQTFRLRRCAARRKKFPIVSLAL
jgi:hypothetical protein